MKGNKIPCPECGGCGRIRCASIRTGSRVSFKCNQCRGTGYIPKPAPAPAEPPVDTPLGDQIDGGGEID